MHIKTAFGYCDWSFEKGYVHIYNLYVKTEFRGRGNAKEILRLAIDDIRSASYNGLISVVANPNKKDDFVDVERLKGFYKGLGLEVYEYYGTPKQKRIKQWKSQGPI